MDVEKSKTSGAPDSWHFSPNGSNTESQQTNPASTQGTSATEPQDGGQQQAPSADDVTWSASEFVAHDKSINWYIALAASVLFFTAIVYLITKDKITSGVIIFAAIIFGVYAARKPRTDLRICLQANNIIKRAGVFAHCWGRILTKNNGSWRHK